MPHPSREGTEQQTLHTLSSHTLISYLRREVRFSREADLLSRELPKLGAIMGWKATFD